MTMISVMWIIMSLPMLLSFAGGVLADRYSRFILMLAGNALAALAFLTMGLTRASRSISP